MKPLPKINADTVCFWDGARVHELRYQRCQACALAQFPPGSVCTHCHSRRLSWRTSGGRGTIHSFTIVHRAPLAEFRADVPYVIALVDLDEGFRMMLNVRDVAPEAVSIGQRVRVIFESTERDDVVLPQAAPA